MKLDIISNYVILCYIMRIFIMRPIPQLKYLSRSFEDIFDRILPYDSRKLNFSHRILRKHRIDRCPSTTLPKSVFSASEASVREPLNSSFETALAFAWNSTILKAIWLIALLSSCTACPFNSRDRMAHPDLSRNTQETHKSYGRVEKGGN